MLNGKELQVGKSYETRSGEVITLNGFFKGDTWPWKTKECINYLDSGRRYDTEENKDDLIAEVTPEEFNTVTKPKHYQLIPEKNIEVKHIVAVLADRLGTNGYNGAFIGDYVQLLQYLMRFDEKNGKEDLEKAEEFLNGMIESYPCVQQLKGQK